MNSHLFVVSLMHSAAVSYFINVQVSSQCWHCVWIPFACMHMGSTGVYQIRQGEVANSWQRRKISQWKCGFHWRTELNKCLVHTCIQVNHCLPAAVKGRDSQFLCDVSEGEHALGDIKFIPGKCKCLKIHLHSFDLILLIIHTLNRTSVSKVLPDVIINVSYVAVVS